MQSPVFNQPGNHKKITLQKKIKYLLIITMLFLVLVMGAKQIEINDFFYDDNLIGLEPIFTQKVKITSVDRDSTGNIFLNIADGSRVNFLGIDTLFPEEAIAFLEKNMTNRMVYLSFEGERDNDSGFQTAYVWTDEIYEYYNVSVLWNAVLIINGFAIPLDFNYTYNEIFFALESQELEVVKSEVEDVNTTRELKKTVNDEIPPGFETVNWEMKKTEVWYRMNKQLIEERDNKLVYITNLYGESCLLTFLFNDDAKIKSVSYVFSFVDISFAEETFKKFVRNLNKIFSEESVLDFKDFQSQEGKIIEAYCHWGGQNATIELLMGTLSRNVHAMRLTFARTK